MLPLIPLIAIGASAYGAYKVKCWYEDAKERNLFNDNTLSTMADDVMDWIEGVENRFEKFSEKVDIALENDNAKSTRQTAEAVKLIRHEQHWDEIYGRDITSELISHIRYQKPLDGQSTAAQILELAQNDASAKKLESLAITLKEGLKGAQEHRDKAIDELISRKNEQQKASVERAKDYEELEKSEEYVAAQEIYDTGYDDLLAEYNERKSAAISGFKDEVSKLYATTKGGE